MDVAAALLEYGAAVDARMALDVTPLHIAASQNNLHCIEVLLNMQPYYDATVLTNKGYSSHYLAKACKALPAVQLMLMDLDDPLEGGDGGADDDDADGGDGGDGGDAADGGGGGGGGAADDDDGAAEHGSDTSSDDEGGLRGAAVQIIG